MTEACTSSDVPHHTEVYRTMAADPIIAQRIARAREAQQHAEIDRTVAMADAATPENWQVVKLQIWARQWRAAKLAPKHYGDKTVITGPDNGAIKVEVSEMEAARRIAFTLARAAQPLPDNQE